MKDFGINRNQLNQARIQGLMKLNERLEQANKEKDPKEETVVELPEEEDFSEERGGIIVSCWS